MTNTEETIKKLSERSGMSVEEVRKEFQTKLTSLPATIPTAKREKRALQILNASFGGGKSNAVAFSFVIVGCSEARDMNAGKKQAAIEASSKDLELAKSQGLVKVEDNNVIVLDALKTFKNGKENNNFGKPLKEAWIRNAIVAAKKPTDVEYIGTTLQLRDEFAKSEALMNKIITTRLLGDLKDGLKTSNAATTLTPEREASGDELQVITEQAFETNLKDLEESFDYVKELKGKPGFYDRYVVTEGTVAYIKKATDPSKSHFMLIKDISTADAVSCFVPFQLGGMLDIGRDSLLTIIAQPNVGKKWDVENKRQTDEDTLQLNVMGIQHVPGMTNPIQES